MLRRDVFCLVIVLSGLVLGGCDGGASGEPERGGGVPSEGPAGVPEEAGGVLEELASSVGTETVREIEETAAGIDGDPYTALGLMAFLSRRIELAGWAFGKASLARPDDPIALNNFGVALHEAAVADTPGGEAAGSRSALRLVAVAHASQLPDDLDPALALAVESLRKAVELAPERSVLRSNLGYALFAAWEATREAALEAEAEAELREAIELDPGNATAMAHLARLLLERGEIEEGVRLLERARRANQLNGVVVTMLASMPPPARQAYESQPRECGVDYCCAERCPRSIIGQIERVSCEMEQSSAQMACEAGEPYAESYDCAAEMPQWGFLIPGLQSGVTIPTPWGRYDIIVQGDGRVDYRFKPSASLGGVGFSLEGQGSWSPEGGFSSVDFAGGVSVNVLHGGAASQMNEYGVGPISVGGKIDLQTGESTVKIDAYDSAVLQH